MEVSTVKSIPPAVLLLFAATLSAEEWSVSSPDGRTSLTLARQADGRLSWRASRAKAAVVEDSPLGIRRADQSFTTGLKLLRASESTSIDERYETPHGKRRLHHVRANERTVSLSNAAGARLDLVLRAHDDGVALRYRFPETDAAPRTVVEELTSFHMPAGTTAWLLPHHMPSRYKPAYEDLFREVPVGTAAPEPAGWSFPGLFKTPAGSWLLVTEAALDESYCGSRFATEAPGGVYRLRFPDPGEGRGVGEVSPTSTLPWTMPWRVVVIGDAAARVAESDLVNDLSPPSRIKDTSWIKPGIASWSWWSESDSPKHAEALNRFVDLAADMGWEYSLVDANWNVMETGKIEDVVAHAREKGVGLLFWYNSGGPHNDVTEAPRDRMHLRDVRRAEFARLKDWGVRGVKVDFWHSDKQDRIRQYRDVLADAADFHLLVNFHGCTLPRGWSREFPNLIGMEAVMGAEQYKFSEAYQAKSAWHNTVLPFTRNVPGPMDYTPVTFTDHKFPHRTTNAHELALSVVFETAIQHFADSDKAYRALPDAPRTFLRKVPSAWDETRVLGGEPGRSVVVARRDGRVWYVGGLSGQDSAQTARVRLSFLDDPGPWWLTTIRDGASDREFDGSTRKATSRDEVEVAMRARGGFVLRITPD
jgi:alpha-glucosidase